MLNFFRRRFSRLCLFLSLIVMALLFGCKPAKVTPIIFRVMTFNIHHGEGVDGKVDLDRIANVILEANADAAVSYTHLTLPTILLV